ncbi:L-lactate dehydrogenase [Sphingobium subterraneum]|uniref:L-lactate dehydrogenase n=1 Tax=Sphingobium subterraneum TaxID=627688 RepID=UPI0031B63402
MQDQDRIIIIGSGHVGATTAYALMLRALFREIILIDRDEALAEAEAMDISDAGVLARPTHVRSGNFADAASARIAVLTAGAATHGSESRLSVTARSADIVQSCIRDLVAAGFDGLLIVAANSVDLMAWVAKDVSGFPGHRVIGTGTLLDSSRLQQTIAARLNVAASSVDALMIGEHGDSSVAALSIARIGGVALESIEAGTRPNAADLAEEVRGAAYKIIEGKGYTSFGVATAIVRICEAIVRDEHAVVPVSTLLTGQYGITDLYLSLPCILGETGVERVLTPHLSQSETAALIASANMLRTAKHALDRGA